MSKITVIGIKTFYIKSGQGKDTIILLHGWGQTHAFWKDAIEKLSMDYCVVSLDLPGFGESQEPTENWKLEDYAKFVYMFTIKLKISHPIIIGHSFGGRIALMYSSLHFPIKKLVLYSSGGLPYMSLVG